MQIVQKFFFYYNIAIYHCKFVKLVIFYSLIYDKLKILLFTIIFLKHFSIKRETFFFSNVHHFYKNFILNFTNTFDMQIIVASNYNMTWNV